MSLRYLRDAVRGVLISEEGSLDDWEVLKRLQPENVIEGLPHSKNFGVGEIVKVQFEEVITANFKKNTRPAGLIVEEIRKPLLNHENSCKAVRGKARPRHETAKIVLVAEAEVTDLIQHSDFGTAMKYIAGFMTCEGGMTSHIAVLARSMGVASLGIGKEQARLLLEYNIAAVSEGRARLYKSLPKELEGYMFRSAW